MHTFNVPRIFNGKNILLKARHIDQASEIFALVDKNREHLKPWMPWVDSTKTVNDSKSYLELATKWWNEATTFDYSLYEISSNKLIGSFGLHSIDWNKKTCSLGYWIDKNAEGKGYIREAVEIGEKIAMDLGFHRIVITCDRINQRSQSVARSLGYRLESVQIDEQVFRGQYRDTLNFVKLINPEIQNKITVNLPSGYSICETNPESFWKEVDPHITKIFDDQELILRPRDIISEQERLNLQALNKNVQTPFEYFVLLSYQDKTVGWSWGYQDGRESFYMVNSAVLPEHRGRGLYSRLLDVMMNKITSMGFQKIWSRHNMTNNAIIIPKLKRGFRITGTELSDIFGVLVHLSYLTNSDRQKILKFRAGHIRPDEKIKSVFKI